MGRSGVGVTGEEVWFWAMRAGKHTTRACRPGGIMLGSMSRWACCQGMQVGKTISRGHRLAGLLPGTVNKLTARGAGHLLIYMLAVEHPSLFFLLFLSPSRQSGHAHYLCFQGL